MNTKDFLKQLFDKSDLLPALLDNVDYIEQNGIVAIDKLINSSSLSYEEIIKELKRLDFLGLVNLRLTKSRLAKNLGVNLHDRGYAFVKLPQSFDDTNFPMLKQRKMK